MTFTAQGSNLTWDTGNPSFTPHAVGDLVVAVFITKLASTPSVSNLSSSNVTWTKVAGPYTGTLSSTNTSVWLGKVTSVSAANQTITWSGGSEPAHWQADVRQFTVTSGDWKLDKAAALDVHTSNTAYPSLTPNASGELYYGSHYDDSGASAGSTSGYTYVIDTHGNGFLFNPSCGSGAQAPTWADNTVFGGGAVLIQERISGTAAVQLKKMRAFGYDHPHYNTGATTTASAVPQSTHPTLSLPAGVMEGDCMIIGVDLFGYNGDTGIAINLTPGVSGNDWTQIGGLKSYDDGTLKLYGAVFVRQATASDAGSTLTFSYSGTPATDQKWWAIAEVSFIGLDAAAIDVFSASGAISGNTVSTPSGTTTHDGAWAVYVGPIGAGGAGAIATQPSGTTLRENVSTSGVCCAIADTNGSVGASGTSIGGTVWTDTTSGGWGTSFSLGVGPLTTNPPGSVAVSLKKMKAAGVGNVTDSFSAVYNSSSGGVDSYDVTSQGNGTGSHTLQVIVPTNPDPAYPHSFLYMLPVELVGSNTYGDPITNATNLGLANTYNTTIISPGYAIDPWYADNPTDATILQETFTIWVTQWAAANLYVTGSEKHYITGFSKSGIGGAGLIFRHPTVFEKAALWDTPADDSSYNRFGGDDSAVYGTAANFTDNYELSSANLNAWSGPFTSANRIWIAQGSSYGGEVADWHTLMTSIGILHTYDATTYASDTHAWHDDWIIGGLSTMFAQVPSAHATLKKMSVSGSNIAKVVQFKDLNNATSGNLDANVTQHNSVFVVVTTYNASNVAIGTSAVSVAGQSLTKLMEVSTPYNGQLQYFSIWGAADSPGGSSAVSATVSNGTFNPGDGLLVFEVEGLGTTWHVDKTVSANSGSGTAIASGSTGSLSAANEFVLAALVSANGTTGTPTGLTGGTWEVNGTIYTYNWAGYATPFSSTSAFSVSGTESSTGPWAAGIVTIAPGSASSVNGMAAVTLKKMGTTDVFTLFGQQPATAGTADSFTASETNGLKFSVSAASHLEAVWYSSPSGCTALPSTVGLYNADTSTLMFEDTSPSWSGAAGSGWVKYVPANPITLAAGVNYMAVAAHLTDTSQDWYPITSGFWSGSGITNGPLSCPNQPYYYDNSGVLALPLTAFGNYNVWIDVEVSTANVKESGTADVTLKKIAVSASSKYPGTVAVTLKKMVVSGTASAPDAGTAVVLLKKMTAFGLGSVEVSGTDSVVLRKMTVAASGNIPETGTAAVTLQKMTAFGMGSAEVSGTGSIVLRKIMVAGSGLSPIFGTVVVTLPKTQVHASDGHAAGASSLFIFSQF